MSAIAARGTSREKHNNFSIYIATPRNLKVNVYSYYLSGRCYLFGTPHKSPAAAANVDHEANVFGLGVFIQIRHKRIYLLFEQIVITLSIIYIPGINAQECQLLGSSLYQVSKLLQSL